MTEFKVGDKVRIKHAETFSYQVKVGDEAVIVKSDLDGINDTIELTSGNLKGQRQYVYDHCRDLELIKQETTTKNLFEEPFELEKLTQFQRSIIKECCDIKKVPYYKTKLSSMFEQSHFYKCIFWNGKQFHGAYNSKDLKAISFLELIQALEEYQPVPEFKVGDNIIFLKKFDCRNVGDIATITRIDNDTYEGAKGWINYETLERKTPGGFRWEGNGYYVDIDFRFATPEEIAKWKEENEIKLPVINGKQCVDNDNQTISCGCTSKTYEWIKGVHYALKDSGTLWIPINGVKVSGKQIEQIVKFIEHKEKE